MGAVNDDAASPTIWKIPKALGDRYPPYNSAECCDISLSAARHRRTFGQVGVTHLQGCYEVPALVLLGGQSHAGNSPYAPEGRKDTADHMHPEKLFSFWAGYSQTVTL